VSDWTNDSRRAVQFLGEIKIGCMEDQIDDPLYEEHQSAVAQRVDEAEKKAQQQPRPVRASESPDSSKKQCHLMLNSMLGKREAGECFSGDFWA
jgi:hypothetical protein